MGTRREMPNIMFEENRCKFKLCINDQNYLQLLSFNFDCVLKSCIFQIMLFQIVAFVNKQENTIIFRYNIKSPFSLPFSSQALLDTSIPMCFNCLSASTILKRFKEDYLAFARLIKPKSHFILKHINPTQFRDEDNFTESNRWQTRGFNSNR